MESQDYTVTLRNGYLTGDSPIPAKQPDSEISIHLHDIVFAYIRKVLDEDGDQEFLVNCDLALRGIDQDNISKKALHLSEIEPKSIRASRFLYHHGLRPNDFIHILIPNTTEYYYPVLGAYMCNANVSVADPTMTSAVISSQLLDTEAKFIFCFSGNLEKVKKAVLDSGRTKIVVMDFDFANVDPNENIFSFTDLIKDAENMENVPKEVFTNSYDEHCLLVWSSGTTGRPKGIPYHRRTYSRLNDAAYGTFNNPLQTTCFFHGGGFMMPLGGLMRKKTTFFFPVESLYENAGLKLLQAIDKFKNVNLFTGSHHLMEIVALTDIPANLDLGSVLMAMPIGTNVPLETEKKLRAIFPKMLFILNLYGNSEARTAISLSKTVANLGKVAQGVTVKIVDPDTERLCGVNEVGEIRVKAAGTMRAYFKRPEETAKLYDEEDFLKMGDLGSYDENNILHFHGRCKELIKYRNNHLSPIEIENVLVKHPKVKDAAVFGRPDPISQELVTALVIKKQEDLTEEDLVQLVDDTVEDFKRLRGGVIFVDSIPRNQQGKILRRNLNAFADQFLNGK